MQVDDLWQFPKHKTFTGHRRAPATCCGRTSAVCSASSPRWQATNKRHPFAYRRCADAQIAYHFAVLLQGGTSHMLGQNFSKMFGIQFEKGDKSKEFAWQTPGASPPAPSASPS